MTRQRFNPIHFKSPQCFARKEVRAVFEVLYSKVKGSETHFDGVFGPAKVQAILVSNLFTVSLRKMTATNKASFCQV